MTEPDETRIRELEAMDRQAGYVPHRSVQDFDRKRAQAVADYERRLARAEGPLGYARHVGIEKMQAARAAAGKIKRLMLRG